VWEVIFSVLIVFSEGGVLTLLPLFVIRFLFHVHNKHKYSYLLQEAGIALAIFTASLINLCISEHSALASMYMGMKVFTKTAMVSLSYPWLHTTLHSAVGSPWLLIIIIFIAAVGVKKMSLCAKSIIPLTFFACFWLFPTMTSMVRSSAADHIINLGWWLQCRYSFIPCVASYIFWVWLLSLLKQYKNLVSQILIVTLVVLSVYYSFQDYWFVQPTGKNYWIKNAEKIDDVRKNLQTKRISIPIEPTLEPALWYAVIGVGDEEVVVDNKTD
jgi:hypothetical protein